jgi:hypothetical protein
MRLVYDESGDVEVKCGDVVHVDNTPYFVMSVVKPHKPASTGRVLCKAMTENAWINEWFPCVIGATWIEREDR